MSFHQPDEQALATLESTEKIPAATKLVSGNFAHASNLRSNEHVPASIERERLSIERIAEYFADPMSSQTLHCQSGTQQTLQTRVENMKRYLDNFEGKMQMKDCKADTL
ncbi:uncharacterized protein PAC_07931 [Phialocephala subalpina]|uniref:Uncharacterized protein n=1 Tax=Phialocephala subalpina TaxID=576137 RepID=A0A1L7WZ68_9HELO|nr:uncharacterized protein PAC_07931 [Phialocephala subalpina]